MKLQLTWIVFLTLCCEMAFAADSTKTSSNIDSVRFVLVKKDSRLDDLSRRQASINKRAQRPRMVRERGYRLQITSTQDRTHALGLKAELLNRFPDHKTYMQFQSPMFRIRFGDFKTRAEAVEFKNKNMGFVNRDIFVVTDMIEYMWYPEEEVDKQM